MTLEAQDGSKLLKRVLNTEEQVRDSLIRLINLGEQLKNETYTNPNKFDIDNRVFGNMITKIDKILKEGNFQQTTNDLFYEDISTWIETIISKVNTGTKDTNQVITPIVTRASAIPNQQEQKTKNLDNNDFTNISEIITQSLKDVELTPKNLTNVLTRINAITYKDKGLYQYKNTDKTLINQAWGKALKPLQSKVDSIIGKAGYYVIGISPTWTNGTAIGSPYNEIGVLIGEQNKYTTKIKGNDKKVTVKRGSHLQISLAISEAIDRETLDKLFSNDDFFSVDE